MPDEESLTLPELPSFITKNSISEAHFHHGMNCEFELNLDVKETRWSVGEWRKMEKRLLGDVQSTDPSTPFMKESNLSNWQIELPNEKGLISLFVYLHLSSHT